MTTGRINQVTCCCNAAEPGSHSDDIRRCRCPTAPLVATPSPTGSPSPIGARLAVVAAQRHHLWPKPNATLFPMGYRRPIEADSFTSNRFIRTANSRQATRNRPLESIQNPTILSQPENRVHRLRQYKTRQVLYNRKQLATCYSGPYCILCPTGRDTGQRQSRAGTLLPGAPERQVLVGIQTVSHTELCQLQYTSAQD